MIPISELIQELLFPTPETLAAFNVVFILLTLVAALAATAFSFTYGVFYPWRENRSGRAAFYLVTALAAVLWIIVLARWLGDYPGRILLTLAVYTAIPITIIRLLVVLLRGWRHSTGPRELRREQVARNFDETITKPRTAETPVIPPKARDEG